MVASMADRSKVADALHNAPGTLLLTSSEAAMYLGTSKGVLANWRSQRRGPRYQGNGDFVRYRLGDIRDWIHERGSETK